MIKRDLIEEIYLKHGGMSREEVKQNVELLLEEIKRGVVKHGSLVISGFGTFRLKSRPARDVKLPNGQSQQSTAQARIRFFPSRNLKNTLNSKAQDQHEE